MEAVLIKAFTKQNVQQSFFFFLNVKMFYVLFPMKMSTSTVEMQNKYINKKVNVC